MDARREWTPERDEASAVVREAWLLGQPPLDDYLEFVADRTVGGSALARAALVDEWRLSNDYYHELEDAEAGLADSVACRDLDSRLEPLAEEVARDVRFRR